MQANRYGSIGSEQGGGVAPPPSPLPTPIDGAPRMDESSHNTKAPWETPEWPTTP